jgi:hypothetical protein
VDNSFFNYSNLRSNPMLTVPNSHEIPGHS